MTADLRPKTSRAAMTRVPGEHFAQNEVQKSAACELLPGVMLRTAAYCRDALCATEQTSMLRCAATLILSGVLLDAVHFADLKSAL
jgi:hypothetical protein